MDDATMSDPRFPLDDDAVFEDLLARALHRRGDPAPYLVDVTVPVMARVRASGPVPRREVGMRDIAGWAIAAGLAGIALLLAAQDHGPSLADIAQGVGHTSAGSAQAAIKVGGTAASFLAVLGRALMTLLEASRAVLAPFAKFAGLAGALNTAAIVAMLAATMFILARDLRSGAASKENA